MVYFIYEQNRDRVKIGYSADCEQRRKAMQTGNSDKLILFREIEGTTGTETKFHRRFARQRIYHDDSASEWFILAPSQIDRAIEDITGKKISYHDSFWNGIKVSRYRFLYAIITAAILYLISWLI